MIVVGDTAASREPGNIIVTVLSCSEKLDREHRRRFIWDGEFGRGGNFKKRIGPRVVKIANRRIRSVFERVTELFLPTNTTRSFVPREKSGEERAVVFRKFTQLVYQTVQKASHVLGSTTSEVLAKSNGSNRVEMATFREGALDRNGDKSFSSFSSSKNPFTTFVPIVH